MPPTEDSKAERGSGLLGVAEVLSGVTRVQPQVLWAPRFPLVAVGQGRGLWSGWSSGV